MGLPDLYPAQVGSPFTTLAAPYTSGESTMTLVDATKLPDAPNIVCLAGSVAGEFRYTGKDGNTLLGVVKLPGTPNATWPAGTYAFRGVSAYDHASIVEHLTYQRSHIVEATLDLTANHTYSGRVLEGAEAGENLAFGDLVVLAESGKFVKANPATLATLDGTIALVVSDTIAAGSQGMFLLRGLIRNDSWTFSPGKELYACNGTLTHEPPTTGTQIIRKVGTALTATIIEFNPSSTLHAEYLVSVLPVNTVTKDNNDIERKFWKDDFSVDSSENYSTLSGSASPQSFDTDHLILPTNSGFQIPGGDVIPGKIRLVIGQTGVTSPMWNGENQLQVRLSGSAEYTISDSNGDLLFRFFNSGADTNTLAFFIHEGAKIAGTSKTFNTTEDYLAFLNSTWVIEIETLSNGRLKVTIPRLSISFTTSWAVKTAGRIRPCIISYALKSPIEIYEITTSPSVSYSDDFTTDTVSGANGRYQAVTGTVAYDDVNKRMTITAGAGVTAKTRLKSYTQLEGAYKRKLHLPATGTDGDVVAAYFGTEPTLESGFGIGAIRTAGTWNIATIDGATVTDTGTVIPDLVDGDSFYVEVERDTTHGVVWYYVYKSGKPTTASGKLFNTYQEIYDGFWFKNNGAAENSIAVSEIEDRAESIVGRTNVEVTEPFWFRDEFSEDSLGRYVSLNPTYCTVSDGKLTYTHIGTGYSVFGVPQPLKNTESTMNINLGADGIILVGVNSSNVIDTANSLLIRVAPNSLRLINNVNKAYQNLVTATPTITPGIDYEVKINITDESVIVSLDGVEIINYTGEQIYTSGYTSVALFSTGDTINDIQISGTRVYNKPIHRGAMLETYHDGTQEVVGTTFVDDCQWDRSAERTVMGGSVATDTTNGYIALRYSTTAPSFIFKSVDVKDGWYEFEYSMPTAVGASTYYRIHMLVGYTGESLIDGSPRYGYSIEIDKKLNAIRLRDNVAWAYRGTISEAGITGDGYYKIGVLADFSLGTFKIYLNGIYKGILTANPILVTDGRVGFICNNSTVANSTANIRNVQIIAAESSSTNGIAACIPPIGGGARYGVEESISIPITPGTEIPVGTVVISPIAKSTVVGTTLTTFAQTPTGVSASLEYATGTKACPSLSTAFAPAGRHLVKADLNTPLLVGVKGTPNSPAVFIDALHLRRKEVVA